MTDAVKPGTLERGSAIPLPQTLGIRLTEVGERHAVLEVDVDDRHRNYYGGAHGGLIATLLDTAAFFPAPLIPAGRVLTTTSLSVSFVRPAKVGDHLVARSELLHMGRRTASLSVRIADGEGRLVAHGTAALMVLSEPEGGGAV